MVVAVMSPKVRSSDSQAYGWFVREMMGRHRIRSQDSLSTRVTEVGHPISQPALSKVISGRTEPSRRLHRALTVAMELTDDEIRQFNDIFALSDVSLSLTDENREGMQEIDEEARQAAEDRARKSD